MGLRPERAALACAIVALALAGCGSAGGPQTSGEAIAMLLRHVAPDSTIIATADIRTARARLGLAPDAPLELVPHASPHAFLLSSVASQAFPDLEQPVTPALVPALDQGKVTAMVFSAAGRGITLIATSQSAASLRARLASAHFRRGPSAWVGPAVLNGLAPPEYVSLFPGGLVVARTPSEAAAAAARHTAPASDRPELAAIRAMAAFPSAMAITYPSDSCISSVAIGDRLAPRTGLLRIVPSGSPQLTRLHTGQISPGSSNQVPVAGAGRVEGATVLAPLSVPASTAPLPMANSLIEDAIDHSFYSC